MLSSEIDVIAEYNLFFRSLFLEYARVMSADRDAMTYRSGDEDGIDADW
jgi:hypothetical protein